MPVVAVAAAAASFTAGTAAFAAATTIGGMVAAGATIVGSALSIIGTVTGNAKLAKIGGILAVGGMAGSALSSAATAAETASTAAADVAGGLDPAFGANAAYDAAVGTGAANAGTTGLIGAESASAALPTVAESGGGLIDTGLTPASRMTDVQSQAMLDSQIATGQPASAVTQVSAETPFQAGAQSATDANAALNMDPFANESEKLLRQQAIPQGAGNNLGGYFDKFGRWVKDNKELAHLGATFASGLLPSDKEKALTEAYKQQTADARRKALWAQGKLA